jgi:hypothetical protein
MDAKKDGPDQEPHGRDALAPVFDNLNENEATAHSTVKHPNPDRERSDRRVLLPVAPCVSAWKGAKPEARSL